MQNLIRLFQKYLILIVFAALQLVCLVLIVTGNHKFHNTSITNSSNSIVGGIYEMTNSISEYFSLREQNNKLLEENTRLKEKLIALESTFIKDSITSINDSLHQINYHLIGAKIINSTISLRKNYLTLNVGSNQGVTENMAIIGSKGVVGYTIAVSNSYSVVTPIINENFRLSVTHLNSNSFGIINWHSDDNYSQATVIDIPISVPVSVGDTIISRGSDAMFPFGTMVGIVEKIDNETGQSFQLLKIKLEEDFSNINKVKVIKFDLQEQQKTLEADFYP